MRIVCRMGLLVLLMSGVFFGFAGCKTTPIDLTNQENYWVKIDGVKYSLGDPFGKFDLEEKFGIPKGSNINGETEVPAGGQQEIRLYRDDAGYFMVRVHNPEASNRPVKDCYISGFGFGGWNGAYAEKIGAEFVGGIKIGKSSPSDVKRIFGEPTNSSDGSSATSHYITFEYPGYSFTFDDGELFGDYLYEINIRPIY